jgi:hypothetical protein
VRASERGKINSSSNVQKHCFERKEVEVEGLMAVASGGARLSRGVTGRGACYCVEEQKEVEKGYAGISVVDL